jgi:hypothetical protein
MARIAALKVAGRSKPIRFRPIDATVIAIKPEWLCSTFAFHPMLRFKRSQQARSIAHGCASTLLTFAREDRSQHFAAWGITGKVPAVLDWHHAFQESERAPLRLEEGKCWLRPQADCPFSQKELRKLNAALQAPVAGRGPTPASEPLSHEKVTELSEIHRLCSERETHLREI